MGTNAEKAAATRELKQMSRRGFLTASAGVAAGVTALSSLGPTATPALAGNGHGNGPKPTVPAAQRGIILFTVRDVQGRAPDPANGIGGGFRFLFEQLSTMGYREVEFAGYGQHPSILGRQITAAEIRQLLDDNGLVANGSHITFNFSNPASFEAELDIAETLGMPYLGTPAIPTGSHFKEDWERAAENFNMFGEMAARRGIRLYQHNHHAEYDFLLDAGPLDANGRPTRSTGLRGLEYFFTLVDPHLVWFEMDIFWGYVARHRYQTFTDPRGRVRTSLFDPLKTVTKQEHRFPLFHVKDGIPADNDDGFDMVPAGTGTVPLRELLNKLHDIGFHHPNYEQDNAPGSDPNQSLEFSQISYENISNWH